MNSGPVGQNIFSFLEPADRRSVSLVNSNLNRTIMADPSVTIPTNNLARIKRNLLDAEIPYHAYSPKNEQSFEEAYPYFQRGQRIFLPKTLAANQYVNILRDPRNFYVVLYPETLMSMYGSLEPFMERIRIGIELNMGKKILDFLFEIYADNWPSMLYPKTTINLTSVDNINIDMYGLLSEIDAGVINIKSEELDIVSFINDGDFHTLFPYGGKLAYLKWKTSDLEYCVYDHATKTLAISTENPTGESIDIMGIQTLCLRLNQFALRNAENLQKLVLESAGITINDNHEDDDDDNNEDEEHDREFPKLGEIVITTFTTHGGISSKIPEIIELARAAPKAKIHIGNEMYSNNELFPLHKLVPSPPKPFY